MDFPASGARRAAALVLMISAGTALTAEPAADSETASATSTPGTNVITGGELLATGQTELTQALAQLVPSLHLSLFSANDGSDHVRSLSAYGLSPDQLVVLVNGKRRHKAALVNLADAPGRGSLGTDLSMLPLHDSRIFDISNIYIEVSDLPTRDIWFLGVILPGLDQIRRVLGTSPPPPPSPPSVGPKWSKYEQK